VTEVADSLDRSKSTVYNHLGTLQELGYVVVDGNTYHVGLKFLELGDAARTRRNLFEPSKREIDELVSDIDEHGHVMVEERGRGVYIYLARTDRAIRTESHIGMTIDLHATAVGKAYLAHLDEDQRTDLLDDMELTRHTDATITDREELEAELATIRERGYSFNQQELYGGMKAVGAPVLGPDDSVLAAISISGPSTRMTGERYRETLPEKVQETARIIGIRATYA